jgi:hypothetical protein
LIFGAGEQRWMLGSESFDYIQHGPDRGVFRAKAVMKTDGNERKQVAALLVKSVSDQMEAYGAEEVDGSISGDVIPLK